MATQTKNLVILGGVRSALSQLGVFGFGLLEDGDVRVGVLPQVPVCSYDMTKFAASVGLRIDGVIGQDVIGKFSGILIDYVRHKITLIE